MTKAITALPTARAGLVLISDLSCMAKRRPRSCPWLGTTALARDCGPLPMVPVDDNIIGQSNSRGIASRDAMQRQNLGGPENYLGFQFVGDHVKVFATDAKTNIEVSIVVRRAPHSSS